MNTWNAGQLATAVRTKAKMDIDYLGPDSTTQNQTIFLFTNISLWKMVRLAYQTEWTDGFTISSDGPITLTKGNATITNMYEPLEMIFVDNAGAESEVQKRYSYTSPTGWWIESSNQPFHMRGLSGMNGTFKFKYIRYPRQITQESDPVDMQEAGYDALINDVIAQVKQVKNWYEEAAAMDGKAKAGYPSITQAAISARGPSSGGMPPSFDDVMKARGG